MGVGFRAFGSSVAGYTGDPVARVRIRAAPYAKLHTPADLLTQFTHTITLHQHYATIHVTRALMGESWCVWGESWHVGRVMYDDEWVRPNKNEQTNPGGPRWVLPGVWPRRLSAGAAAASAGGRGSRMLILI